MKVFNTSALTQKQRFNQAVIVGTLASIVLGIIIGYLRLYIALGTGFEFSIVTIGGTYVLAMVIQKVGRGVQPKFSILGAVLGFILVSISSVIAFGYPLMAIFNLRIHLSQWMLMLTGSFNSLFTLMYQVIAIYVAYSYSRIV